MSRKKSEKRKEERLIENGRERDQERYEGGEKKENKVMREGREKRIKKY